MSTLEYTVKIVLVIFVVACAGCWLILLREELIKRRIIKFFKKEFKFWVESENYDTWNQGWWFYMPEDKAIVGLKDPYDLYILKNHDKPRLICLTLKDEILEWYI